jgi:DNA-directed RNA polymerase sigma subunit (sigma70/sigma32)
MDEPIEILVTRARSGDRAAAAAIVERLRPSILELARALDEAGFDIEVAAEETTFAIACAIRRFSPAAGMSFTAYALHWMHACVTERLLRSGLEAGAPPPPPSPPLRG